jgi:chromosome segregation ATPase
MKWIAGAIMVGLISMSLTACSERDNEAALEDLRAQLVESKDQQRELEEQQSALEEQLDSLRAENSRLKQDVQIAADAALTVVRKRNRTITLFEGCMQDIIDETNRVYNLFQWGPALRTAFNGANCSALGYYWG